MASGRCGELFVVFAGRFCGVLRHYHVGCRHPKTASDKRYCLSANVPFLADVNACGRCCMILLSWVANFAAFVLFALAMPRNRKLLLPRRTLPIPDTSMRIAGVVLLALSLYTICKPYTLADAIVYWTGQMTITAISVALVVSFRQKIKNRK